MYGDALAGQSLPNDGVISAWPAGTVFTYEILPPGTPACLKNDTVASTACWYTIVSLVPLNT